MAASTDTHLLLEAVALCRTKIANLVKLGVGLRTAIITSVSSKSYWHLARTPATQQAMSNAWLKAQGLVSIKECWMKAQGYIRSKTCVACC